jgi:hypothetical protein
MKTGFKSVALSLMLVLFGVAAVYADDNAPKPDASLGDVARQLKAQKAKESKPAKVITNDSLESDTPLTASAEKESPIVAPPGEGPSASPEVHNEEYYRAKMSKLQGTLETHQRELNVLQQKLGQNQMQYYDDPNKSLQQQYSRDDITKLTADIDEKKDEVASDNKAIDDLRDQLRHEGGDAAWIR